jgi:GT2 family glycosyltransferase
VTRLAIVIVSYNARDDLARCLAALHGHPPAVPHEIVVVDNASGDGSAGVARRWVDVRLIALAENTGFARGCNAGIRASAGPLVLLLNSDTIVPAGAIDALVAGLERRPDAAAAGPRIVDATGAAELSFGPMIGPLGELRQKALGALYRRGWRLARARVARVTRRPHEPDWVSGACLLVRRADAEAVGLLDERFFMYGEDVDFCAALRARGRRILFVPDAEIVHARGASARADPAAAARAYRRSQIAFYRKHHPAWVPLLELYLRVTGKI